jgi:hypothetical protein
VELAHQLGGFDIDGVLVLENAGGAAKNEAKGMDVFVQVGELELNFLASVEVVELKGLEIADENVAREFRIFDAGEIVEGLFLGFC